MQAGMIRRAVLLLGLAATGVHAEAPAAAEVEARIEALQRQYQALRERTERELAHLAREIDALRSASTGEQDSRTGEQDPRMWERPDDALTLSGDFRLRYEHTSSAPDGVPSRNRGVLRGRLGADYRATERLTVGARLVTGDPDDPNSADITLGDFTDDLDVSLDRAYARWGDEAAALIAGKFANPLARTDLVWDGDVNPQGLAGRYRLYRNERFSATVTGLYALVDEQSAGADSSMAGAQLGFSFTGAPDWTAGLNVGYYDYHIGSLANADAGDIRGNRLDPSGTRYRSDFDLLDVLAEVSFEPAAARWPVTVNADYVRNLGAAGSDDTGYSGTLSAGRLATPGDVRLGYTYTAAETDAVFAAYAHDNITYATNYRLHALSLDYMLGPHMRLNLTGYRYERDEPLPGTDNDALTRVRLNWSLLF